MNGIYTPSGKAREYAHNALNLFNGCSHRCFYCWVPKVRHISREDFAIVTIREGIIEQLKKDAVKYAGTDDRVLLCFTCDPYPESEEFRKVTRQVLEILRDHDIPFNVLSKAGRRARADFDLYGPKDIYSATLTYSTDGFSIRDEPGAALPFDRIQTLRMAHEKGIQTEVSLEPVLDPQEVFSLIARTHEFVNTYKIGKLNYSPTEIDWRWFGTTVLTMLHKLHKQYYIKRSLADFLHGVPFENTDTRRVNR